RRPRIARRYLRGAPVGELGRWRHSTCMIDQRIAQTDPQLCVARVFLHCVLQDPDGILALPVPSERFGHPQPALSGREMTVKGVARVSEGEDVAPPARLCPLVGEIGAALPRV